VLMVWSLVKPPASVGPLSRIRRLSSCSTRAWTVSADQETYALSS